MGCDMDCYLLDYLAWRRLFKTITIKIQTVVAINVLQAE